MRAFQSYVVKVYRQKAAGAIGTVQDVTTGRIVPFQTMEELWNALGTTSPTSVGGLSRNRQRKGAKPGKPLFSKSTKGNDTDESQD